MGRRCAELLPGRRQRWTWEWQRAKAGEGGKERMEMGRDGDARQVEREFHRVEVGDALQPAFFFGARRYVSSRREVHRCTAGFRLMTRYLGERDTEQTSASGSAPGAALCLCPRPGPLTHGLLDAPCGCPVGALKCLVLGPVWGCKARKAR